MTREIVRMTFVAALSVMAANAAVAAPTAAPDANEPPYARLASDLGTPELARAIGPKDKSQLLLNFVRRGESYKRWTKMTTISILKVLPGDTTAATKGVVTRFKANLQARHASIGTFEAGQAPVNAFFTFTAGDEADQGVAFSPAVGYVSVIQVGYKHPAKRDAADGSMLRTVAAGAPH